jgi:hypothetical protein
VTLTTPESGAQLHSTADLVCVAWLRTVPGLTADVVATQLPADENKWAANGAVTVPLRVGGTPHSTIALKRPVVQVDCWGTVPGSDKIPWGIADQLCEQIRMGCLDRTAFNRPLAITAGGLTYPGARVLSAKMLTEPRRIWGDQGEYGGFTFNVALQFISAGEEIP